MPSTPIIKYWNLKHHPFSDTTLKGKNLSLFINREDELEDLTFELDNNLIGLSGSTGVGKSSFIYKYCDKMKSDKSFKIFKMTASR